MASIIKGNHHTYPPVGHCIYCGTSEGKLSKEHIVPFALNGGWVLPKASCAECAKKTQKIEEVCTHEKWGMLYPFRARFKLRSRQGWKDRGKIRADVIRSDGSREQQQFEITEFPAVVYGVKLPPAGILTGDQPSNKSTCTVVARVTHPSEGFNPKGGLVEIGRFRPTAFIQLIAKIGSSFAAAETGTDGLLPMLSDIILGKTNTPPYLIGGGKPTLNGFENDCAKTDYLHQLQMHECEISGQHFTMASVHLFGQLGMPKYHVVVRQRLNDQ